MANGRAAAVLNDENEIVLCEEALKSTQVLLVPRPSDGLQHESGRVQSLPNAVGKIFWRT